MRKFLTLFVIGTTAVSIALAARQDNVVQVPSAPPNIKPFRGYEIRRNRAGAVSNLWERAKVWAEERIIDSEVSKELVTMYPRIVESLEAHAKKSKDKGLAFPPRDLAVVYVEVYSYEFASPEVFVNDLGVGTSEQKIIKDWLKIPRYQRPRPSRAYYDIERSHRLIFERIKKSTIVVSRGDALFWRSDILKAFEALKQEEAMLQEAIRSVEVRNADKNEGNATPSRADKRPLPEDKRSGDNKPPRPPEKAATPPKRETDDHTEIKPRILGIKLEQITDFGQSSGRTWADFNGDGYLDYCRVVGQLGQHGARLAVTLSTGRKMEARGAGDTIYSNHVDAGYEEGRAWADFNGDRKADYHRVVGVKGQEFVSVTLSAGNKFGAEFNSGPIDWGYSQGRAWGDFNGDGKADYLRVVGVPGNYRLQISISMGTKFGIEIQSPPLDPGYPESRIWKDVNGDGRIDFVRVVGNRDIIQVTFSNGLAFGKTISEPLPSTSPLVKKMF